MKRFNTFTHVTIAVASLSVGFTVMSGGVAVAASYQRTDGTIVDPIQYATYSPIGGDHPYAGNSLEPFADLVGASLPFADLHSANLTDADLSSADLFRVDLIFANASGLNLTNADLSQGNTFGSDLTNANLSNANLTRTDVFDTNFTNANFTNASLPNANAWNTNFNNANLGNADLSGADLTGADLSFATMTGAFYDENTVFPSGNTYDVSPSGLDADQRPWEAGMIPVPEPGFGVTLLIGGGLVGMSLRKRTTSKSL